MVLTLERAPHKVSGAILSGANFGGLVWLKKKMLYDWKDFVRFFSFQFAIFKFFPV